MRGYGTKNLQRLNAGNTVMKDQKIGKIKITQIRSTINRPWTKTNVEALGLQRIRHSVVHNATPQILGMVNKVKHLVQTEEVK